MSNSRCLESPFLGGHNGQDKIFRSDLFMYLGSRCLRRAELVPLAVLDFPGRSVGYDLALEGKRLPPAPQRGQRGFLLL